MVAQIIDVRPDRTLFVSVSTYLLGKALGIEQAGQEFSRQLAEPTSRSLSPVKMVRRLQHLGDVHMWHGWSTELAKLRSRAANAALDQGSELWVTVDDDVECDTPTLECLLDLATPNSIAVLPCVIRGTNAEAQNLNCVFATPILTTVRGHAARVLERGGTGLMVVSRGALQKMRDAHRDDLAWDDDDGKTKVALFEQRRIGRCWYGEDYSFCLRARELGIDIYAPAIGTSLHAGRYLDLRQIEVIRRP